jgi:hypothetical protein
VLSTRVAFAGNLPEGFGGAGLNPTALIPEPQLALYHGVLELDLCEQMKAPLFPLFPTNPALHCDPVMHHLEV